MLYTRWPASARRSEGWRTLRLLGHHGQGAEHNPAHQPGLQDRSQRQRLYPYYICRQLHLMRIRDSLRMTLLGVRI